MRKLNLPAYTISSCVELCADNIEDKGFTLRLLGAMEDFLNSEKEYIQKGPSAQLFSILENEGVGEWVGGAEMAKLYDKTFVRKNGPTRHIYDAIKLAARDGICPLCNQRVVSTLDHYLSKSEHPALALVPLNLVPACRDCNSDSAKKQPKSAGDQTLHPYFDSADDKIWLVASVQEGAPPGIVFAAEPPQTWSQTKQEMVKSHFRVFGLGRLYSVHAAGELVNIYYDICPNDSPLSPFEISEHLKQQAANRRHVARNSWQAAMYQALAESAWFCSGGYGAIVSE